MAKLEVTEEAPWYLTESHGGREISVLKDEVESATKAIASLF